LTSSQIIKQKQRKIMPGKAAKILLTETQKAELDNIKRSRIAQQRWIQRAQIILLAAGGMLNTEIGRWVGVGRQQVGLWRRRWQQSQQALLRVELDEPRAELRRTIEDVLSDAPRSGTPGKFAAEEVVEVIAVACEDPKNSNRPITHWRLVRRLRAGDSEQTPRDRAHTTPHRRSRVVVPKRAIEYPSRDFQ
jgi:Helix-turn-helix domain